MDLKNINHTFVIPAYKDSLFLEACINSLVNQTVSSHLLIATSTPSDYILNLAKKYEISVHIHNTGFGIADDWNFSYKLALTPYITIAHQDDVYLPNYTENCLYYAQKATNKNFSIIFTDYYEMIDDRVVSRSLNLIIKRILLIPFIFKNNLEAKFYKRLILSFGDPISCPSVMFNKLVIPEFEFSNEFECNMDWDAWLRLAETEGKFVFVKTKLMIHRLHRNSQTSKKIISSARFEEDQRILRRIWGKSMVKILAYFYKFGTKSNVKFNS